MHRRVVAYTGSVATTDMYFSYTALGQTVRQANQYDSPQREYSPTQSRWWTPDPAGLAAVDPNNPQS